MGKNNGKTLATIGGFFLGAGGWGQKLFGLTGKSAWLVGGMYGASLSSNIWTATHQQDTTISTSYNFDILINRIPTNERIPIIYGTRKWSGYQSY